MKRLSLLSMLLLAACSPHPGAGVWKPVADNAVGIERLIIAYDGRGLFATTHPKASWHCFWSGENARTLLLDCTPSTNPEQEVRYRFRVTEAGQGELLRDDRLVARFRKTAENAEIP
jgi:hypothetical protein